MTTRPDAAGDPTPEDIDAEDAFGHPALGDPIRDEVLADGDEEDVDG